MLRLQYCETETWSVWWHYMLLTCVMACDQMENMLCLQFITWQTLDLWLRAVTMSHSDTRNIHCKHNNRTRAGIMIGYWTGLSVTGLSQYDIEDWVLTNDHTSIWRWRLENPLNFEFKYETFLLQTYHKSEHRVAVLILGKFNVYRAKNARWSVTQLSFTHCLIQLQ